MQYKLFLNKEYNKKQIKFLVKQNYSKGLEKSLGEIRMKIDKQELNS